MMHYPIFSMDSLRWSNPYILFLRIACTYKFPLCKLKSINENKHISDFNKDLNHSYSAETRRKVMEKKMKESVKFVRKYWKYE